ncbi:MAG TPA: sodium-translocating pyrophosphatase [Candidatus Hydrogenedentes bacterium]|jgi:K(+)-stimulated pyrophosphate-energized sodium pump|nr:MAG: putative K(+)-stimulated pyrophosphate-energized sodium pump [Candidatus Hydrogenedentes bacterium ADurb.Bin170]HOD96325.1 sodium-translocating pyrophosphatase [Candidatus Hydrogenedentota bacterium]HOR51745.1 sodium-translocating pyrophosphatase [Candidatus Hydrogenedentota bacterium]HPK25838.1 sodium-translocating pyrophosphatase [Candidatus Hydrogenedentota bacterium]HPX87338.1 sodium-translocating pyrophosphatase [Candidatus Hydrogenedentota bacterium]
MFLDMFLKVAGAASIAALLFVVYLARQVLSKPQGTERMAFLSTQIQKGAAAFLKREYTWVSGFVLVIMLFFVVLGMVKPDLALNWKTAVSFLAGSVASACAGVVGMWIATRANARTAAAAEHSGVKGALDIAISGGAVMGMAVVGISLLGLVIIYKIFDGNPTIVNGYAMGASLVALFGRSGGGIFTKGADMGADLVGKVEAGIPEDDPRNPAVIADNVGDNVGDVAGLGADLLESYVEAIIAPLAVASIMFAANPGTTEFVRSFPFFVAAIGIFASIIGVMYVKLFAKNNPQSALMNGTYISAVLAIIGVFAYTWLRGEGFTLEGVAYGKFGPAIACVVGIIAGMVVGFVSEYFTSGSYRPVQKLAEGCQTGPAIAVTNGTAVGMQSTALPVLVLAIAVMVAAHYAGVYGVAIAALGMLATTGMVVAVDAYGPIADNAGGIAEMAHMDPKVRHITDNLDAVGNTTAAIGKGFAIGSAAFAAIGLLSAFMLSAKVTEVSIADPHILAGLLIGAMMPFFFSSLLFGAVGRCADTMIQEVRRQFREIPGLREGLEGVHPDSTTCVSIATQGAIKGMLLPGGLAIVFPLIIGLSPLGSAGLAGMLVGAIATGVMLGIQTANSGGAMDNAKKYIEEGNFGGKGSEAHKAAVVGDTVGDPLKDTVGPSINILIKLMCVIALVLAPLFAG